MTDADTFLRLDEVTRITGLHRSSIYEMMADQRFPKQVKLGKRAAAWLESEIRDWQRARVEARNVGEMA